MKYVLIFAFLVASAFGQSFTKTTGDGGFTRSGTVSVNVRNKTGGGKEYSVSLVAPRGTIQPPYDFLNPETDAPWCALAWVQLDASNNPITATALSINVNQNGPYTGSSEYSDIFAGATKIRVTFYVRNYGGGNEPSDPQDIFIEEPDPEPTKEVRVSLRNTTDFPVTYKLYQDGVQIGQTTLAPGQGLIQSVDVPSSSNVTVTASVNGIQKDGPVWVEVPGATHEVGPVANLTPTTKTPGVTPPVTPIPEPDVPKSNNPTGPKNDGKPTWIDTPPNNDPTQQKDLVTNATFKEGMTKQISATNDVVKAVGNGNDKLETIKDDVKKLADALPVDAANESAANAKVSDIMSKATSAINAAKSSVESSANAEWSEKVGNGPTAPGSASGMSGSGSSGWPVITVPILGTIELSPARIPWVIPVLNAARELILWFLLYWFVHLNVTRANEYDNQLMTVNPAPLTVALQDVALPVVGQLLAWGKSLLTALSVVVIMIGAYAAAIFALNTKVVGLVGVAWDLFASTGNVISSRLGSAAASPFWSLMHEFFPLDALLYLMFADMVLLFSMGKIFLFASFLVRAARA